MGMLTLDAVVHWSIPVNNLEEGEKFYSDILGLTHAGRLTSRLSCFALAAHKILLASRRADRENPGAGRPLASRVRREC
jgi:extradiol dioxygenase family protein